MSNPFDLRTLDLSGPARDIQPVTPSDSTPLTDVAVALYVQTGGALAIDTVAGATRIVQVGDQSFLPVGVTRVRQTGTTASGIFALTI